MLASACWLALPDALRKLIERPALAAAMTFVVNTTDDGDDGACDAAHCSLREEQAEMVRAFISSIEYRRRFGQP